MLMGEVVGWFLGGVVLGGIAAAVAPAPTPAPAPAPAPKPAAPTKADCEAKCARFAGIWKGSSSIEMTIRKSCVSKCVEPGNNAYRDCVDTVTDMKDMGKCNGL